MGVQDSSDVTPPFLTALLFLDQVKVGSRPRLRVERLGSDRFKQFEANVEKTGKDARKVTIPIFPNMAYVTCE